MVDFLKLVVENKPLEWGSQYITGAEIKELAGIQPASELYLSVTEPYDDVFIENHTRLDLARGETAHFFIKKDLPFKINNQLFHWHKQFITGKKVRQLGGIDQDDELFLAVKEPYVPEKVNEATVIDIALTGVEHFFSKEKHNDFDIIVDGTHKKWDKKQISFKEVVLLAYGKYIDKPTMVYTVAYEDGPKQNPEGSMRKDNSVFVKDKMIFHATATDKS